MVRGMRRGHEARAWGAWGLVRPGVPRACPRCHRCMDVGWGWGCMCVPRARLLLLLLPPRGTHTPS